MGVYHHHSSGFPIKESVCVFFSAPGIYSSIEMLDFGTLRSQGKATYKYMSRHVEFDYSLGLRRSVGQSTQALVLFLF